MRHKLVVILCDIMVVSVLLLGSSQDEPVISESPQARSFNPLLNQICTADPSFIKPVKSNWNISWDGSTTDMIIDSEDNLYVVGRTPAQDAYVLKYSSEGVLLDTLIWGGSANDGGSAVGIDSQSNLYLAGYTNSFGEPGRKNCFLVKYNQTLDQQWNTTWYMFVTDISVENLCIDTQDNVVVIGYFEKVNPTRTDLYIRKYNTSGHLQWETQWSKGLYDHSYKALIDSKDNLYIWSVNTNHYPNPDYTTILNISSSGSISELKVYSGYPLYDIALDSNDNFIVLAHFYTDYEVLRKYDAQLSSYTEHSQWIDYEIDDYLLVLDEYDNMYIGGGWYRLMKFNHTGVKCWSFTKAESAEQYPIDDIIVNSEQNIYCLFNNKSESYLYMYDNSTQAMTCLKEPKFAPKELYATIIANSNYPGDDNDLNFGYQDRRDMLEHLREDCNVPSENIKVLSDAWYYEISDTLSDVSSIISENDDYLFYFSGHGGVSNMDSYLCPYDSLPPYSSSNRYYWDDLDRHLGWIDCENTYVFLDACHSGGFTTDGVESGEFVMSSCTQNELSLETFDFYHGVFTYYWLESFLSAEDGNDDGLISLEERYTYISSQTAAYSAGWGVAQHPQQYDGIIGYNAFHPSAAMKFSQDDDKVKYDLTLFGSGQIFDLFLHFKSEGNVWTVNLSAQGKASTHGFGQYSGTVYVGDDEEVQECEMVMDIKGERYLTISMIYEPEDEDEEEVPEEIPGINWAYYIFLMITGVIVGIMVYIVYKKIKQSSLHKKRSFQKQYQATVSISSPSMRTSRRSRFCTSCGGLLHPGNAYCTHCGKKIT